LVRAGHNQALFKAMNLRITDVGRERAGRIPPRPVDASTDLAKRFVKRRGNWAFAIAGLLAVVNPLRADLSIVESYIGAAAKIEVRATRLTKIKGLKMRVEDEGADEAVIYDVPAGEELTLNAKKRQARVRKFAAVGASAERAVPAEWVKWSIQPTGDRQIIAGTACEDYTFTIRVPVVKDGKPTLVMTGKACVAKAAEGAAEYRGLVAAGSRSGFLINYTSNNIVFVSLARAQTKLYEILAEAGGIPMKIERDISYEGGFFAALLNKSRGSRRSVVTHMSAEPLPQEDFSIPAGWKRITK
jgi:hypothetical protein